MHFNIIWVLKYQRIVFREPIRAKATKRLNFRENVESVEVLLNPVSFYRI
jgi:hypothetical protein